MSHWDDFWPVTGPLQMVKMVKTGKPHMARTTCQLSAFVCPFQQGFYDCGRTGTEMATLIARPAA